MKSASPRSAANLARVVSTVEVEPRVNVSLSPGQAAILEQLGAMVDATPAEIILALAVDRLAMNLIHADTPASELRAMLWRASRPASVNEEWQVESAEKEVL